MLLNNSFNLNPLTSQLLHAFQGFQTTQSINKTQSTDDKVIEAKVIKILNNQPNPQEIELDVVISELQGLGSRENILPVLTKVQTVMKSLLLIESGSSAFFINEKSIPIIAHGNRNGWSKQKSFDLAQRLQDPQAQSMLTQFLAHERLLVNFNPFDSPETYTSAMHLRDFAREYGMEELQALVESHFIKNLSSANLSKEDLQQLHTNLQFGEDLNELRTLVETRLISSILSSSKEIPRDLASIAPRSLL